MLPVWEYQTQMYALLSAATRASATPAVERLPLRRRGEDPASGPPLAENVTGGRRPGARPARGTRSATERSPLTPGRDALPCRGTGERRGRGNRKSRRHAPGIDPPLTSERRGPALKLRTRGSWAHARRTIGTQQLDFLGNCLGYHNIALSTFDND